MEQRLQDRRGATHHPQQRRRDGTRPRACRKHGKPGPHIGRMNTRSHLPEAADAVVVGGGIIGCSTAYYLARAGLDVVVCEKGWIGCEQSSRNWGLIRKQGRHPAEIPLMIRSLELWHDLVGQIDRDIGFRVNGTLYLSETEERYEANRKWMEHARDFGLDTRMLGTGDLEALAPGIRNQKRDALFTPSDASAEPHLATRAIADLAIASGGRILEHCAVRGIDLEAGRVAGVATEHGRIRTGAVVCAGGAWSGYFCHHLGIRLPQLKVASSVMLTRPTDFILKPALWSGGLGLRRRPDGSYIAAFAGTADCPVTPDFLRYAWSYLPIYRQSKEIVRVRLGRRFFTELGWPSGRSDGRRTPYETERVLDPAPNADLLGRARKRLGQTFPDLADIRISRTWAGMIDTMPDELPVIDEPSAVPGLVISTGYSGHGFGIGPGAGRATADLVLGKADSSALIGGLSFGRLA
ncbi:MAG: FAD-binding oxidoreductase [Gammaproteobacteria bacterium]|nr:FAD-binding oxidoreductase [Gammaproteobacteria bacterium]MYJ51136.1 FAD-binding oxidoreductase [Gammaproteobacteria bacterium]